MTEHRDDHFRQRQRRKAEFITPPNTLRIKVGEGGIDERIIEQAEKLIENSGVDFLPMGQRFLTAFQEGIRTTEKRRGEIEDETLIATMLYPAMQLKANGGMFGYPLVSAVAGRLVQFLEVIPVPDDDAMDIVNGFSTGLQAIMMLGGKAGQGGNKGEELLIALENACIRYFEKNS